ncbi:MAG TPA: GAF domain-containing sensor histidine kinase, partial [Kofleriaceae bacterium]|nr:GAF domain-containing sensor histidine kinase [Kofleriaceae bacterium]
STERVRIVLPETSAYGVALHARRAIVANDVTTTPQTVELDYYCRPLGITSMLDAPFYYRGAVGGVICHEHVGPKRVWSQAEIDLACSIADMAAVICSQAQVLDAKEQLRDVAARRLDGSRIETLAHVATAIGHELSNTLTSIQLAMTRIQVSSDPRVAELAPALGKTVTLATELLEGLKRFGRAGVSGTTSRLGEILPALAPMLQLLTRDFARVTIDLEDPAAAIALPDSDLQQVLVNLVINAANAIEAGKTGRAITIRTRAHGDKIELTVGDDGPGVSPAIADRLFGVYVTTSPHGTGLGLWLVKQIVEEVGGTIRYEPTSPGARFVIELPVRAR